MEQQFKRKIAYKLRIGPLISGNPILEAEKLKYMEVGEKQVVRVNIIANIIDKYVQDGEKKFASITLDDATGQIKVKAFGDETEKFSPLQQGDTILVIGLMRYWNNEPYVNPEIIKKKELPSLILRKLEAEKAEEKTHDKKQVFVLKENIINILKEAEKNGGIEIEKIIMESKDSPEMINKEIKKLLEDGLAYEPRPGKLRWLG